MDTRHTNQLTDAPIEFDYVGIGPLRIAQEVVVHLHSARALPVRVRVAPAGGAVSPKRSWLDKMRHGKEG